MGIHQGLDDFGIPHEIYGVDNRIQRHYPFYFVQGDALKPPFNLKGFDFIWASPPCQKYSGMKHLSKAHNGGKYPEHPDLIEPVRKMLDNAHVPYVIENVPQSPIHKQITLCGRDFGLKVYRHRHFESNMILLQPFHTPHRDSSPGAGNGISPNGFITVTKIGGVRGMTNKAATAYMQKAMGMEGYSRPEIGEAVPPAYSRYIIKQIFQNANA